MQARTSELFKTKNELFNESSQDASPAIQSEEKAGHTSTTEFRGNRAGVRAFGCWLGLGVDEPKSLLQAWGVGHRPPPKCSACFSKERLWT